MKKLVLKNSKKNSYTINLKNIKNINDVLLMYAALTHVVSKLSSIYYKVDQDELTSVINEISKELCNIESIKNFTMFS